MHPNVAPQNSALLTMGTRYYGQQVKQSFPALHYLARLGVEPDAAIRAGFGYCPGEGLKEYLEQRKADPEEIEESTLFQDITGMEFLAGCITLSDLDFTGATIWMIGLLPDEDNQQSWNAARPRNRSIQGKRNRFFNMTNIRENEHGITVTDDPRLYLLMKASGMTPAMFHLPENGGKRVPDSGPGGKPAHVEVSRERDTGDARPRHTGGPGTAAEADQAGHTLRAPEPG